MCADDILLYYILYRLEWTEGHYLFLLIYYLF